MDEWNASQTNSSLCILIIVEKTIQRETQKKLNKFQSLTGCLAPWPNRPSSYAKPAMVLGPSEINV